MESNPPPGHSNVLTGSLSSGEQPSFFVPYEEPPSQIARIIGIIAMVMGGLSIFGSILNILSGQLLGFFSTPEMDLEVVPMWFYFASGAIGIGGGIGFLYGGYRMQKFEMIGQWITLGTLVFVTILQLLLALITPEEVFTGGQDLSEVGVSNETVIMFGKVASAVGALCQGGFCGVVLGLPLIVGNHGLR
jgi:hypothetical protein